MIFIDIKLKDVDGLYLAKRIRGNPEYSFAYIIFISDKIDYIITAFKEYHCYDYFVKPLNVEKIYEVIYRLINHIIKMNQITTERPCINFNFRNTALKIYIENIYFIESSKQKSLLYSKNKAYDIFLPFNKVLQTTSPYGIIQTHRSFAVNPSNISFINKSTQPWEVVFFNYEKTALISRKYKKAALSIFAEH